jgi:hypothetical protein
MLMQLCKYEIVANGGLNGSYATITADSLRVDNVPVIASLVQW